MNVFAHQALGQGDFDFNIEQPDWVALRILMARIEQDAASRRKHLLRKVSDWFLALDMLRDFEVQHFVDDEPQPRDREYMRVFLTQMMAQGERLQLDLDRTTEISPQAIGIGPGEVGANVQYLRDKYARQYFEVESSRAAQIITALREPQPAS